MGTWLRDPVILESVLEEVLTNSQGEAGSMAGKKDPSLQTCTTNTWRRRGLSGDTKVHWCAGGDRPQCILAALGPLRTFFLRGLPLACLFPLPAGPPQLGTMVICSYSAVWLGVGAGHKAGNLLGRLQVARRQVQVPSGQLGW